MSDLSAAPERNRFVRHRDPAIRLVACFEAAKGLLVLVAASGLLSLMHRDIYALAYTLVEHAHLNPAAHFPQIFLDAALKLRDTRLWLLAAGALAYATVRLVEAYGLYFERTWAEALAAVSGAIYVPFEVLSLLRQPSWHGVVLLVFNLAVVGLMVRTLIRRHRAEPPGAG
jgi:uncharacterized membrane protein (DUF2068 family)